MKKIVLINSYSDNNKGDLGIIIGTIKTLKESNQHCEISAISSFAKKDIFFKTEHEELKKYVTKIVPTVIGRVDNKSLLGKIIKVMTDYFKIFFINFSPKFLLKIYLKIFHKEILSEILSSDLIISKGGSFLCNRDNYIDKIRLDRELTIFKLCLRFNKKIVIWGQSIGPVYGKYSNWNLRKVLRQTKLIVVREEQCLSSYDYIFKDLDNLVSGHDLAFSMDYYNENNNTKAFEKGCKLNIGLTLKHYNDSISNNKYLNLIKELVIKLNDNYECNFHFVPHVTIDPDLDQVKELVSRLPSSIDQRCISVDENNYSINKLLDIYNNKDLVIGTRLHSTIFTLITNTRVINIGYHGTKAQGVFKDAGLENYQFHIDIKGDLILKSIYSLLENKFDFSEKLSTIRKDNLKICNQILKL